MERPFAITLDPGSSRANLTGSWRVERPVYVDLMPPCNDACPAGENCQGWLYHAESGDYEASWRRLVEDNPLPAIMGRVCYHPCETACNRGQLDEAVGINAVERFLGDLALERGWELPGPGAPTGRSVLVVGAGPAGLSCAYQLARLGHHVVVADANDEAGGMMRYGIPAYRLPRDVLDAEVGRILRVGVELELGHTVRDLDDERREGGFDAVFLGVGAQLAKRAYIPAGDSSRVLDALGLLRSADEEGEIRLGRHVAIYGGGNTAMDAARTARRLGATDPVIVYRRTREVMPAHEEELKQALEEGITVRWLSTIGRFEGGRLSLEKMRLNDENRAEPTGEVDELEADTLVLALGQDADLSLVGGLSELAVEDGVVQVVSSGMATGAPGIFAGGDVAGGGDKTVTVAIGHGKAAARGIDSWLRGDEYVHPERPELAAFERLNTWYYADAPRTVRPELDRVRRQSTFDEVVGGLDESNALFEARRCMSCGNCFECDNCYGVCPDNAVLKLGPGLRYSFDLDYCKGCGICATECPCGAIVMEPELI
ncbi:MAG TPA: NAD(P)-binding protein [Acidimicrobiales bacterium]|nr:NAD(P)-binding protein [Acidimicrobiales bacterium]